jgi:hypothetical protein
MSDAILIFGVPFAQEDLSLYLGCILLVVGILGVFLLAISLGKKTVAVKKESPQKSGPHYALGEHYNVTRHMPYVMRHTSYAIYHMSYLIRTCI